MSTAEIEKADDMAARHGVTLTRHKVCDNQSGRPRNAGPFCARLLYVGRLILCTPRDYS